jgi:predicted DCC family thiol-disulfide oxidoreductase YuxK
MPDNITIMEHPTLLFDGYCNLCNRSVLAVIKRDPQAIFRFASLHSESGQSLLAQHGINSDEINSVVLVYKRSFSVKSDAVFDVFKHLGGFYGFLVILKFIPPSFRNWIYDWVARNRTVWFGKKDACMLPTPDLEDRFLS